MENPPKDKASRWKNWIQRCVGLCKEWRLLPGRGGHRGNHRQLFGSTEKIPLTDGLFINDDDGGDDDGEASKARDQLPETRIVMLVHWYGTSFEDGVKRISVPMSPL